MTANGWTVRVEDRTDVAEVERVLRERRLSLDGLRRAVRLARQEATDPTAPDHDRELRRAAVEAQQAMMRHALRTEDLELLRRTGRGLRVRDLAGEPALVEALLGVVRDARSAAEDTIEAARLLAALPPA